MKTINSFMSYLSVLYLVLSFFTSSSFADSSNRILFLPESLDVAEDVFEWSKMDYDAKERNPSPVYSLNRTNPKHVTWLIPVRAEGEHLEFLRNNPNLPEAKLQRMILADYPIHVNRDSVISELETDHLIRKVRKSSTVNVSKFFSSGYGNPVLDQWAFNYVNTTQAWALAGGWAYVAVPDFGVDENHPDLIDMDSGSFEYGNFHKTLAWDVGNRFVITSNKPKPYGSFTIYREEVDEGIVRENGDITACSTNGWAEAYYAGHGTSVATILAGNTDNGIGAKGGL